MKIGKTKIIDETEIQDRSAAYNVGIFFNKKYIPRLSLPTKNKR